MKLIKLFDWQEIERDTGIDILEYFADNEWEICNDTATSWYVNDNEDDETSYKLNQYFISKGCIDGEKILIDICW